MQWLSGSRSAGVIGYRVNEKGDLSEFTRQACPDGMGCHLAVHPSGNFLLLNTVEVPLGYFH